MALTFKEWRLAKGITQEEMAKACDVHLNTYARWENHPQSMSIVFMAPIAKRLGVSTDEIIFLPSCPQNESETTK